MRQTDLTRTRDQPSSDQRGSRRCMMHTAEWSLSDQRLFLIQDPHNTVYFCDLHALLFRQRWKYPCDASCGQCLSTARRTDEKKIVSSRHSQFCCPTHILLTSHFRKILLHGSLLPRPCPLSFIWLYFPYSVQKVCGLLKAPDPDDLNPLRQSGFPCIFYRNDAPGEPGFLCLHHNGQDPRHFSHPPVQAEFPYDQTAFHTVLSDLSQGRKDRRRDRKVKRCPSLPHRSRGQIDDRPFRRETET